MDISTYRIDIGAGLGAIQERGGRIRHQVFVNELGYEKKVVGKEIEVKKNDVHSLHFVLTNLARRDAPDRAFARLVLPHGRNSKLPCQEAYEKASRRGEVQPIEIPVAPYYAGETSRLATIEDERMHGMAHLLPIMATLEAGWKLGLKGGVILIEPDMAKHLRTSGLIASQIGQPIDFKGERVACWVPAQDSRNFRPRVRNAFAWAARQVEQALPTLRASPVIRRMQAQQQMYALRNAQPRPLPSNFSFQHAG